MSQLKSSPGHFGGILTTKFLLWAIPRIRLGLSGRNSGEVPGRPRKRSQSASWNWPREYGWDPPSPINSLPLSTAGDAARLFFQKWFRRGPLRAGRGIPSNTEGISDFKVYVIYASRFFLFLTQEHHPNLNTVCKNNCGTVPTNCPLFFREDGQKASRKNLSAHALLGPLGPHK